MTIRNGDRAPLTLIVEPWANEYELAPGENYEVVAINPAVAPTFYIVWSASRIIVYVNEEKSTYELWQRGEQID